MGKNMNLIPSLLLLNKQKQLWLWPASCTNNNPKTLSFRATNNNDLMHITNNNNNNNNNNNDNNNNNNNNNKDLLVVEPAEVELTTTHGTSCFTNSSESASISTDESSEGSAVENIVRGARSDRLFFEPDATSSILETQGSGRRQCRLESNGDDHTAGGNLPYKESVAMVMESENPYFDFKKSMEEMVKIHEFKDWDCLVELLGWYLRMNGKNNHEFIVGAFFDLLAGIYDGGGGGACLDHQSTGSFTSVGSTFSSSISQEKMVTK